MSHVFRSAVLWLLALTVAMLVGELVALFTALLIGHAVTHMPGGSLGAGLVNGYWTGKWLKLRPMPMIILLCGLAGVIGWAAFVYAF